MGEPTGLSLGVREAVNFLGGCSEKTKFCALEVIEDVIPSALGRGFSTMAEDGRDWCTSSENGGCAAIRWAGTLSVNDSEEPAMGKPGMGFLLFVTRGELPADLSLNKDVWRGGKETWSYVVVEEEFDPCGLLRSLESTAGAILMKSSQFP